MQRERDPQVIREELEATLNARRELGAELEPQLIEGFLERTGNAIDARVDARLERAAPSGRPPGSQQQPLAVALGSLGIGIPLTGAAGGTVGFAGVLVVWIGIAVVNLAYALGNRR